MAMIEWGVRADEFAKCNCSYGCPCQFSALPTYGFCEALAAWKGSYGQFAHLHLSNKGVVD